MDRENLESLDEESLFNIQNIISEIIKERNFKKGDLETIIENAFSIAFPKVDGLGLNPWVEGSILICPGARIDKSQTRHVCKFVVVEEDWSWESSNMINDVIRRDQSSKNFRQHSITLISPFEGMSLEVVTQKSQNGQHLVNTVESYKFTNGNLDKVMTKSARSRDH